MPSTKIPTQLTLKMAERLYHICMDYEIHLDNSNMPPSVLYSLKYHISDPNLAQNLHNYKIASYKEELLIILDYHQQHVEAFPKRTYTALLKAINAIQPN